MSTPEKAPPDLKWQMTRGARYATVFLAFLTFALAAASMLFTVHAVSANDHKFCQVVTSVTTVPVPEPKNPEVNPSRERAYLTYLKFRQLSRDLGCG